MGIDREYEPNLEDEREEDLSDEPETTPPPTIDPDERIEAPDEEDFSRAAGERAPDPRE